MTTYFAVLSFLLLQSCIHCHVINPSAGSYEIIDLSKQWDEAKKAYWQDAQMMVPDQVDQNSWLKYLSEEFRQALKKDISDTTAQTNMYQQQMNNAQYEQEMRDKTAEAYREHQKSDEAAEIYREQQMADRSPEVHRQEQMVDRTPEIYREHQTADKTHDFYRQTMNDQYQDFDHTKVKKAAQMGFEKTNYPQYANYISKQVDVRSPKAVFVTFPEHTQVIDEFGRIIRPTTAFLQPPQRYMNENLSQFNEKMQDKKIENEKSQEKLDQYETAEKTENEEKQSSFEQTEKERKTNNKHDKKEDKHKKQSRTKHEQKPQMKNNEHKTSQQQDKQTDNEHEEEKATPSTYTQNPSKYKTPIHNSQNMLLSKLNEHFTFGKNVI